MPETNPCDADTDGDGVPDGVEDSNYNGIVDFWETDPTDASSSPAAIVHLKKGFNLISIHAAGDLRAWLQALGDSTEIEKVMAFAHDGQACMYVTLIPGDPSNVEFTLQGAEGLIVYAKEQKDIGFASVQCPSLNLRQGSNLVAFGCPVENYSAFQVLTELGSTNASSIQRYNPGAGAFETVAFDLDNQLVGVDFPVVPGEGYFVYMK